MYKEIETVEKEIKKAGRELNVVRDVENITKEVFGKIANGLHPNHSHKLTFDQKAADVLTKLVGSWAFIFSLLTFIAIWITINILMVIYRWDSYPFVLLNLILSCLAAMQAPLILMSQNRAMQRDRLKAEFDYRINKKAEREIREIKQLIQKKLNAIEKRLR